MYFEVVAAKSLVIFEFVNKIPCEMFIPICILENNHAYILVVKEAAPMILAISCKFEI